jgi:hypothetical protein
VRGREGAEGVDVDYGLIRGFRGTVPGPTLLVPDRRVSDPLVGKFRPVSFGVEWAGLTALLFDTTGGTQGAGLDNIRVQTVALAPPLALLVVAIGLVGFRRTRTQV